MKSDCATLTLRIAPELKLALAADAKKYRVSINSLISVMLAKCVQSDVILPSANAAPSDGKVTSECCQSDGKVTSKWGTIGGLELIQDTGKKNKGSKISKQLSESISFTEFWKAWPDNSTTYTRKRDKADCLALWHSKGLDTKSQDVMRGLEIAKASSEWAKNGGEFIPEPARWLRKDRWAALIAAPIRASPVRGIIQPGTDPVDVRPLYEGPETEDTSDDECIIGRRR